MICRSVLGTGAPLAIPIEEDNHSGRGLHGVIRPLPTLPEPLDTVDTACELRNDTSVDRSDEKEAKDSMSAEDAAYERKVRIGNTLRALFPILAFVLFGVLIMLLQGGRF